MRNFCIQSINCNGMVSPSQVSIHTALPLSYLSSLDRLGNPTYIPSEQDVLRTRESKPLASWRLSSTTEISTLCEWIGVDYVIGVIRTSKYWDLWQCLEVARFELITISMCLHLLSWNVVKLNQERI